MDVLNINILSVDAILEGNVQLQRNRSGYFHFDSTAAKRLHFCALRCIKRSVVPPTRLSNLHVRWLLADTTSEYN